MAQEKPRKKNGIRISSMTLCLGKGDLNGVSTNKSKNGKCLCH